MQAAQRSKLQGWASGGLGSPVIAFWPMESRPRVLGSAATFPFSFWQHALRLRSIGSCPYSSGMRPAREGQQGGGSHFSTRCASVAGLGLRRFHCSAQATLKASTELPPSRQLASCGSPWRQARTLKA